MGIIYQWMGLFGLIYGFIEKTRSVINNVLLINQKGAQVEP